MTERYYLPLVSFRFHANSFVLKEQMSQEQFVSHFGILVSTDVMSHPSFLALFSSATAKRVTDEVAKRIGEDHDYVSRLRKFISDFDMPQLMGKAVTRKSDMDCLILGDTWINNMMFKYVVCFVTESINDGRYGACLLLFEILVSA